MKKRLISLLLVLCMVFPCAAFALEGVLTKGETGAEVLQAQQRLQHYGYYDGKLDSVFGNGMRSAVLNFQRRNALKVDGKIGTDTWTKLMSHNAVSASAPSNETLRTGMHGEEVKELQRKLRETFYYAGKIDGIFGYEVRRAVMNFQASTGLKADGLVGDKTKDALFNKNASIFKGGIPVRNLQRGDRGYDVLVLQNKLHALNFLVNATNGVFDAPTMDAVKAFQKMNGLDESGRFDSTLRRYLWPSAVDKQEEADKQNQGTADDPYQEPTVKKNSHGPVVANAQMRLKAAGYLLGKADGIFGIMTNEAVIALQKDYNLKADGIVGPATWKVLKTFNVSNADPDVVDPNKPAATAPIAKLRRGSRGADVTRLQGQLIQLGYLPKGEDDGIFGLKTFNAVKAFQTAQKLRADGVVGTKTYVRLNEVLGIQWQK